MRLAIRSASINEELFAHHKSFLYGLKADFHKTRIDAYHWKRMVEGFNYDADFIVWLDDDVFIHRIQSVYDMIEYMQRENIDYMGMPEKGYSGHRSGNKGGMDSLCSFLAIFKKNSIVRIPISENNISQYYGVYGGEPHYALFHYLEISGLKRGIFTGRDHKDCVTTILTDHNGIDFGFHTWYSRAFRKDCECSGEVKNNTQRILNIIEEARSLCQK